MAKVTIDFYFQDWTIDFDLIFKIKQLTFISIFKIKRLILIFKIESPQMKHDLMHRR